jgi:hypothetical protein
MQPSLEVEQAEDVISNNNLTDITDIIRNMMKDLKDKEVRVFYNIVRIGNVSSVKA